MLDWRAMRAEAEVLREHIAGSVKAAADPDSPACCLRRLREERLALLENRLCEGPDGAWRSLRG